MPPNCPSCKKPVDSSGVKYKGKLHHQECYEAMLNAARAKDAKKAVKASDPDRKELEQYLLSAFELEALTPLLRKQIDDLNKKYPYADILYTVRYIIEIDEGDLIQQPSIGLVPYKMDEAMAFKSKLDNAQKANESFSPSENETIMIRKVKSTYSPYNYDITKL